MLDPDVVAMVVAGVAVLLLTASVQKWRAPARFEQVLLAYQLFPRSTIPLLTFTIPALESALAVTLLLSRTRWVAALGAALLMWLYAAGIAINLARGRVTLNCGCAGPAVRRPIAAFMVVRNVVIGLAVGLACAPSSDRSVGLIDVFTVAGGLIILIVLYAASEQLSVHVQSHRTSLRNVS